MVDDKEGRTFREKLLFYTTAFFILLGTFSMFAFLFLVPFVIEPAITTIMMKFEETPALCETFSTVRRFGNKNCTWSSCREGCTKEIYECTQIKVNYKLNLYNYTDEFNFTEYHVNLKEAEREKPPIKRTDRYERAIRDYEYDDNTYDHNNMIYLPQEGLPSREVTRDIYTEIPSVIVNNNNQAKVEEGAQEILVGKNKNTRQKISNTQYSKKNSVGDIIMESGSIIDDVDDVFKSVVLNDDITEENNEDVIEGGSDIFDEISQLNRDLLNGTYFFVGANLYPNVKGCGYPPMLNCTIWLKRYKRIGVKFPCYYSTIDPSIVISDLDYWQNTLNLIYSTAIPIPSFIISVIYLTYAYFKIYNEDEETVPLDKNAEDMDIDEEDIEENIGIIDESDNAALADNIAGSQIVNIRDSITADSILIENAMPNGDLTVRMTNTMPHTVSEINHTNQNLSQTPGSQLTPNSEILHSFGHQLKVQMADELSRDSLANGILSTSNSIQGNLGKIMTTSIAHPPGPVAAV